MGLSKDNRKTILVRLEVADDVAARKRRGTEPGEINIAPLSKLLMDHGSKRASANPVISSW
jgi:hypothetical protein